MKLIVITKQLQKALHGVERTTGKQTYLPILQGVLIKTENGRLKLTSTNLEIAVTYWIGAKIEEEGEIVIPVRVALDFIGNIEDDKTILVAKNDTLSINTEHYKTNIKGLSSKDFPIIPKILESKNFRVNSKTLKNSLSHVFDASATSETRPELNGIYLAMEEGKLTCAATDSFRLGEFTSSTIERNKFSCILPRSTANEIIRICNENEEDLDIRISDNQIQIISGNGELVSKLVDGKYPEYQKIIPQKFSTIVIYPTNRLMQAIKAASIFSSSLNDVTLKIKKEHTEILSQHVDKGALSGLVNHKAKGEPFEVNINCQYFVDGLKNIQTPEVSLQYVSQGAPLILRPEDENSGYTYLVMPLKTKNT